MCKLVNEIIYVNSCVCVFRSSSVTQGGGLRCTYLLRNLVDVCLERG